MEGNIKRVAVIEDEIVVVAMTREAERALAVAVGIAFDDPEIEVTSGGLISAVMADDLLAYFRASYV